MHRRVLSLVLLLILVASCGGGGGDTTTTGTPPATAPTTTTAPSATTTTAAVAGPAWALPALEFLDSLRKAVDRGDVDAALAFYREDAVFVDDVLGVTAQGWRRLGNILSDVAEDPLAAVEPGGYVFIDPTGGLVTLDIARYGPVSGCPVDECVAPEAEIFQVTDSLISYQTRAYAASTFEGVPEAEERFAQMARLVAAAEEAWRDRDPAAYEALVAPAPYGPTGAGSEMESAVEAFPDIQVEALTMRDLGLADSDAPAVFSADPLGTGRAQTGIAVFRLTLEPGVSFPMVNWWGLWDGLVTRGRSLYPVAGWDELAELTGEPIPADFWPATMGRPEPSVPVLTGTVEVPDAGSVEVYDGSDEIDALLRWGMDRFSLAGLDPPVLRSLTVESRRTCTEGAGWASTDGDAVDVRLCVEDDPGSVLTRFTLLHELGHAWTATRASDDAIASFLDDRGLEAWWDPVVPWQVRGIEQAAEILAWGLMDDAVRIVRIPDAACDRLAEGFEALTGVSPVGGCAQGEPDGWEGTAAP